MNARRISAKILTALAFAATLLGTTARGLDLATVSPGTAQVVKLHESNVAPEVLLAYVNETPMAKPTGEEVLYLTQKGVPSAVIVAMLSKRVHQPPAQSQPAPAQTQTQTQTQLPPAVAPTQPAAQTVVVQQPARTVTYVSPPPVYYAPRYYDPWPSFAIGFGLGHFWHHGHHWGHWGHGHHWRHGHHGQHGHGGIRVHRR